MTYARLIFLAIAGRGRLRNEQIYRQVRKKARAAGFRLTRNWRATVRNTLQRHSRQNQKFTPPHLFTHHDRNIWEC